jgi:hypothetical protein
MRWGVVFGLLQAATPLAFWWLDTQLCTEDSSAWAAEVVATRRRPSGLGVDVV